MEMENDKIRKKIRVFDSTDHEIKYSDIEPYNLIPIKKSDIEEILTIDNKIIYKIVDKSFYNWTSDTEGFFVSKEKATEYINKNCPQLYSLENNQIIMNNIEKLNFYVVIREFDYYMNILKREEKTKEEVRQIMKEDREMIPDTAELLLDKEEMINNYLDPQKLYLYDPEKREIVEK